MASDSPLLSMRNVRKRYGPTIALDGVDLEVAAGEIHAVIGENGAGKSTLMKTLCGVVEPDSGEITLGGAAYRPQGPAHAARNGLAMIHQELNLAPHLSVEANILLGMEKSAAGFLNRRTNLARAREALAQLQREDIPLDAPVRTLGIGERQIVEIARALVVNARIIVMDEPTSSLSGDDRAHLFAAMRRLRAQGISLIYISHFLEEIQEICDRFTVLRDGKTVGAGVIADTPQSELIRMMVGRKIEEFFPPIEHTPGDPALSVRALSGRIQPRGFNIELRRGEICGLAGLVGAGRTESLRCLFGLDVVDEGAISLHKRDGLEIALYSGARSRVRNGVGLLSEDRKSEGLALNLGVAENIAMAAPQTISSFGFIRASRLRDDSQKWISELSIRTATPTLPVGNLSGGNQQKVAIARLLQMNADVFLLELIGDLKSAFAYFDAHGRLG